MVSIDNTTKVNIGILITLLASTGGGAFYLASMNSAVQQANANLVTLRKSVDDLAEKITSESKTIAVLETLVKGLTDRVHHLETTNR